MVAEVLRRGKYSLTPVILEDLDEIVEHLSEQNVEELMLLGHSNVSEAIRYMILNTECYIARKDGHPFTFVGGLWPDLDGNAPQMFALFSSDLRENFVSIARGSKDLLKIFEQYHDTILMKILMKNEAMLNWACWLGFTPVEIIESDGVQYVSFVRCILPKTNVYTCESRPVMH
jgi:hypothetical protein